MKNAKLILHFAFCIINLKIMTIRIDKVEYQDLVVYQFKYYLCNNIFSRRFSRFLLR